MSKVAKKIILLLAIFFVAFITCKAQMQFVQNKGQWDAKVNYKTDISTGAFFLESNGFTVLMHSPTDLQRLNPHNRICQNTDSNNFSAKHAAVKIANNNNTDSGILHSHAYKVSFLNCNTSATILPDKILPTYNNYFIGNDKSHWAGDCKIYQAITYKNIYPNIDVRYYFQEGNLKYDLIIHPGGNPNAIAMRYNGATKLQIKNKELIIGTSVGDVKELYPYSYQSTTGKVQTIDCKYVLSNNVVTFKINDYDATQTLVIDPTLIFSSLMLSAANNYGYTATPGPDGSFFAGGIAFSSGYPVSAGASQSNFGGQYDIAIMKLSPNGSNRVYGTYLGGSGKEQPHSMICDAQGNLIVAGRSNSGSSFPGTKIGPVGNGDYDIIITKFNATGTSLIGSIKIGGKGDDGVNIDDKEIPPNPNNLVLSIRRNYGDDARSEVILDDANNIYLASCTKSNDFPIFNSTIQTTSAGSQDGVILKFTPTLSTVLFSTYFGGSKEDACFVLSINPINGNLYVAGSTASADLPGSTAGAIYSTYQKGDTDGFITEIKPDGSSPIIKTTYIGTNGADMVYGIKFDKYGFPYIMGTTTGTWPLFPSGVQTFGPSRENGKQFICKLQSDLSAFVYSTVFGSSTTTPNISPVAFLVDRCQNVYISGWGGWGNTTESYPSAGTDNLPEVNALTGRTTDNDNFYFFVLERDAKSQLFGSQFGQPNKYPNPRPYPDHVDGGTSRFDANGIIYQAMCENGTKFPTTPGVWGIQNGNPDPVYFNEAAVKIELDFAGVAASIKSTVNGVARRSGCVPVTVNFTDTLAKGKMYIWDYGDITYPKRDTTFAPNNFTAHTYNQVGNFSVMLIAIDPSSCNIADTAYINIKVGSNDINPNFNYAKLDGCQSLRYQFNNTTTAVIPTYTNNTFTWDFGDNSPRVTTGFGSVIHSFPSTGTYIVTLLVDDTTFCNAPDSIQQTLRIAPNVKALFTTPAKGCVPYTPIFKNTSIGGTDWLWDLGDGTTSTDFEPVHIYNNAGTYNVRLIANDATTCNKTDTSAYFTITVYPIPTALATWSPNPPITNTITTFTNQSLNASSYLWDYGDGETSTDIKPSHQYNATATYKLVLVAYNAAGCTDTFRADVPILINPLLDVPNAFTPGRFAGGSYNNGIVKVEGFGIGKMMWKIYNRWGQVVFSTTNRHQGWDGTFKGTLQPMDVYAYTLDVEFTDGKKYRKTGDITLLR